MRKKNLTIGLNLIMVICDMNKTIVLKSWNESLIEISSKEMKEAVSTEVYFQDFYYIKKIREIGFSLEKDVGSMKKFFKMKKYHMFV